MKNICFSFFSVGFVCNAVCAGEGAAVPSAGPGAEQVEAGAAALRQRRAL